MKKLLTVTFVLGAMVVSMSSCKKDYTCTCKDSSSGMSTSITYHTTKKKAKDACSALQISSGGSTTTCSVQ